MNCNEAIYMDISIRFCSPGLQGFLKSFRRAGYDGLRPSCGRGGGQAAVSSKADWKVNSIERWKDHKGSPGEGWQSISGRYYFQLTTGCGQKCSNPHCASSSTPVPPNEAAAKALHLFKVHLSLALTCQDALVDMSNYSPFSRSELLCVRDERTRLWMWLRGWYRSNSSIKRKTGAISMFLKVPEGASPAAIGALTVSGPSTSSPCSPRVKGKLVWWRP